MKGLLHFDMFKAVYWVIALATAQHTAWGASTTMQGSGNEGAVEWWLQGVAFAIAVDFTMVMVATKIRTGSASSHKLRLWKLRLSINWYAVTFIFVAAASFYFQLLYAWSHAQALATAGGVADEWTNRLQPLIDARIVIAPAALPFIATLYTLGGFGKGGEVATRNATQPLERSITTTIPGDKPVRVEKIATPLLTEGNKIRNGDGVIVGHICPGCGKELSRSGWSRHKKTCSELLEMVEVRNESKGDTR